MNGYAPTLQLLHGRVCMSDEQITLLADTVASAVLDHLEIGSLWGGTAIVAAKARAGVNVVCIDPFTDRDADWKGRPSAQKFWENMAAADVLEQIELHDVRSNPWPLDPDRRFGSVLIDGNHRSPWPEVDWANATAVSDLILLHDVNEWEHDVRRLHERIVRKSAFRVRASAGSLYVYERR